MSSKMRSGPMYGRKGGGVVVSFESGRESFGLASILQGFKVFGLLLLLIILMIFNNYSNTIIMVISYILGGGFKDLLFSALPGEMIQFD